MVSQWRGRTDLEKPILTQVSVFEMRGRAGECVAGRAEVPCDDAAAPDEVSG